MILRGPELVDDGDHLEAVVLHLRQQLVGVLRLGDVQRRLHDALQRRLALGVAQFADRSRTFTTPMMLSRFPS